MGKAAHVGLRYCNSTTLESIIKLRLPAIVALQELKAAPVALFIPISNTLICQRPFN